MIKVEQILRKQIEDHDTPSVQYAFFDKDQIRFRFHSGLADVGNRIAATEQTTYHGFSTTKTFTALAILQLAEHSLLDIHQPVARYLPDFLYSYGITIRHLLTHTAGIPNPIPLSWIHLVNEHDAFDRNLFFKDILIRNQKVKSAPNEQFAYSNLGYIILGQLIEKVSGLKYEEYIEQNIIRKLDIEPGQLGFLMNDPSQHAKGYHKKNSFSNLILGWFLDKSKYMGEAEEGWKPFNDYYVNGAPYGGLIGTADAYARYIQTLLNPDSVQLSPEFKKLLFVENHTNNGKPTGMCLSWFTGVLNGHRYYTHAGGGGGYYCEIRIYPERGVGSVIMFNRTGMTDERFLDKVDRLVIGKEG